MRCLAVIPARGGSKGIPRKNARLLAGKPLIYYAIQNALLSQFITDVVVTTDDEEIARLAELYNAKVILRGADLSDDFVTLDPVVYNAVRKFEDSENINFDIVVTLQTTSPLLKETSLTQALQMFIARDMETLVSVVNRPKLSWGKKGDVYYPLYEKRVNRQDLPSSYSETGAFIITKREFIKESCRFGPNVSVYELKEEESHDIDNFNDWILCEAQLRRKKIIFRVDGYIEIGMGHIYNCLSMAFQMIEHDVLFVSNEKHSEGIEKIMQFHMPLVKISDETDFFAVLAENKPDIVVVDCLDTQPDYIKSLKKIVPRIVTIEDNGEGALFADAVINALYEKDAGTSHIFYGEKYICLRDEFLIQNPKEFCEGVNDVVFLFGGTDPTNYTSLMYKICQDIHGNYPDITFTFVTGIGYNCTENGIVSVPEKNIVIIQDTKRVSDYLRKADIAVTSQGRTIFEVASLGVPAIVVAHNNRETAHSFAKMENGFINLGLNDEHKVETIKNTFEWLIHTPKIRREMREMLLSHNFKNGIQRVKGIILGDYF